MHTASLIPTTSLFLPALRTAPPSPTSTTLQPPSPPTLSSTSRSTQPLVSSRSCKSFLLAASSPVSSPSTRRATCSPLACKMTAALSLSTVAPRLACWAALSRMQISLVRLPRPSLRKGWAIQEALVDLACSISDAM